MTDLSAVVGVILFTTAWVVAAGAWLYGAYEFISLHRLRPSVFRRGRVVWRDSTIIPLDPGRVSIDKIQSTQNGKYKFVTAEECVLCEKLRLLSLRLHTPFALKGRIRWAGGRADIEGRLPLGPSVFFGAWLLGWTVGGMGFVRHDGLAAGDIGFVAFGWLVVLAICAISLPIERRRFQIIVAELRADLSARPGVRLNVDLERR